MSSWATPAASAPTPAKAVLIWQWFFANARRPIPVRPLAQALLALRQILCRGSRTRVPYPERDKTATDGIVMAWLVLVVSGALEAVWATALGRSEGLTRVVPTVVFACGLVLSMAGLAYAMRTLPTGTSYAVWVGIGATLTVIYAMLTGQEPFTVLKALFLALIIGGVVGLKVLH